jgi:hypothetical protein
MITYYTSAYVYAVSTIDKGMTGNIVSANYTGYYQKLINISWKQFKGVWQKLFYKFF